MLAGDGVTAMNDLFLRACRREAVERPPVWMMRQAGRYLPEYRAVRARADFLTMVRTPELAVEVTLQPVDLLGVDAAIIFSDILVVPQAMGMALTVEEGIGPRFHDPLRAPGDFERLRRRRVPTETWATCSRPLRLARARARRPGAADRVRRRAVDAHELHGGGRGTKTFTTPSGCWWSTRASAHALLERLATIVGRFLVAQVEAGAQAVQLFDSWAARARARATSASSRCRIWRRPSGSRAAAGAPVIAFAPGAGWALEEIAAATGADVIGVDWQTDAADARRRLAGRPVALQGNLDPDLAVRASRRSIRERTHAMLDAFGGTRTHRQPGPRHPARTSRWRTREASCDAVKEWRSR